MQHSKTDDMVLLGLIGASIATALAFDLVMARIIGNAAKLNTYVVLSLINVLVALCCLWLRQQKRLSSTSLAFILLVSGMLLVTAEMTLVGDAGKNVPFPYAVIIIFAAYFGEFLGGLAAALLASLCMVLLVTLQLLHPDLGEIAFSGKVAEAHFTIIKNAVFFFIIAGLVGFLSYVIHWQHKMLLELDELKENFSRGIVHELRTPLTSMRMGIYMLMNCTEEGTPAGDMAREVRDDVESAIFDSESLIDNLLTIGRIQDLSQKELLEEVNLSELLMGIVKARQPLARVFNAELTYVESGESVVVSGHYKMLELAVSNFISNALKHLPAEGGKVAVSAACNYRQVEVYVQDNGRGIEPSIKPHIFERFYTSNNKKVGGVGLHVTKEVAKLHGGDAFVLKTEVGKGTTMCLRIKKGA